VPSVVFFEDHAADDGGIDDATFDDVAIDGATGTDAPFDVATEAGDVGTGDAPSSDSMVDAPADGGAAGCPDSVPPGVTACCGLVECIGNCSSCSACAARCTAVQECCVKAASVTCHAIGSSCP
jgi:hypothetical protein